MNYTIELSENRRYLLIKTTGAITMDTVRDWSSDLEKKSCKTGIRRFLFDARSSTSISSIIENYRFAHHEAETLNMQRTARSAILVSEDDQSHDFVETTLRNAGFTVKLFTHKSSAEEWLEE
jgi:hypothetical protein